MEDFVIIWFLFTIDAQALYATIKQHHPVIGQIGHSIVITTDNETFVFNKHEVGYKVICNNGASVVYRIGWQEVQEECLRLDCAHRQAEEDRHCSLAAELEYEKVNAKLKGARLAFDLITGQIRGNYHYAPKEKEMN